MKITLTVLTVFTLAFSVTTFAAEHAHEGMGNMNMAGNQNGASSHADGEVQAEVRKINMDQGKVTLKHGDITHLDMPGMTMVFRVRDKSLLNGVAVGDKVLFTAERINNEVVVTSITKQ